MATNDRQLDLEGTLEYPSPGDGAKEGDADLWVDDATVIERVEAALRADRDLASEEISVDAKAGRVVLDGRVANESQIGHATGVVMTTLGVVGVDNRLRVRAE